MTTRNPHCCADISWEQDQATHTPKFLCDLVISCSGAFPVLQFVGSPTFLEAVEQLAVDKDFKNIIMSMKAELTLKFLCETIKSDQDKPVLYCVDFRPVFKMAEQQGYTKKTSVMRFAM